MTGYAGTSLQWTKILTRIPPMDTFNYRIPSGTASVCFYGELSVPPLPASGGIYVADTNTAPILRSAPNISSDTPLVVIEAGESHKTMANIEKILSAALETGLGRDGLFVGFGGGVITDMTAFAASLYMRGACVELVPTTLLAMADAAIGGKTGIDFGNYKNCVGTFFPARVVHVSIPVLKTLERREFLSGLAEVFKTALLYAPKLLQILETRRADILSGNSELLLEIVKRCVQAKTHVVERDPTESGERMYLNLGHTFAHALESVAGFGTVTHGEAVAWGIARAFALGVRLGVTDPEYVKDVLPVLESYGWASSPIHPAFHSAMASGTTPRSIAESLLSAMKADKKKKGGAIRFVLQRELNSTLVSEVSDADILAVLV